MYWYIEVLKKYAVFSGRARRKEYWMFVLVNFIIGFILGFIEGAADMFAGTNESILATMYQFTILIPSIAVGVRRMHDVGKSGWFILIPIYNFILTCTDGDAHANKYGLDPKEIIE
ncbi:MAG: DUF805 domain-containing protein [Paludibacteraceae bacterium]|nr:DUF805 domain-containing protein [Paludibacteraceae bacterium]MBP6284145.1 DUF805 domain-containing protein [Paludibacteraceae bacterium]